MTTSWLAKLKLLLVVALLWSSGKAYSGDFAEREIYGFSADGRLFAFEEFGRQDGSGFTFSSIYVIDTETDNWTANSPFRVVLEDEDSSVFDAREEARILAGPVMKSFEDRGTVIATNRATEKPENSKRMAANPRYVLPFSYETLEFRLETIPMVGPKICEDWGTVYGFRLIRIGTAPGETTKVIHEDEELPKSRLCPLDYDFADLVTYYPENGTATFAVLLLMKQVGFEGPDGRYLAITGKLD